MCSVQDAQVRQKRESSEVLCHNNGPPAICSLVGEGIATNTITSGWAHHLKYSTCDASALVSRSLLVPSCQILKQGEWDLVSEWQRETVRDCLLVHFSPRALCQAPKAPRRAEAMVAKRTSRSQAHLWHFLIVETEGQAKPEQAPEAAMEYLEARIKKVGGNPGRAA